MKTLKQIQEAKKVKVGIPLSDKEQNECFKEWLEQKRYEEEETRTFPETRVLDELLEELEK